EESDRQLSWKSQIVLQGVHRASGSAVITVSNSGFALAIRVTSATKRRGQADRGIWSDIFPVALPPDQAYIFCHDWLKNETQLPKLSTNDEQPCPCTLDQALLDIVRFQPDPDCSMFSRTSPYSRTGNCLHRRDATHCIRLVNLGQQGVDNLCCYDNANNLIDSRVKEGGSIQRYHYLGGHRVQPYITNFYFDVLPFLHCCRYSLNVIGIGSSGVSNLCPSYFKHRKFSSCKNYIPPRPARTNGDPHITTLDGFQYTFNGVGEFVFMKTVDERFQSQIRFEQFRKENGDLVDASICTSFVSQDSNNSAVVEVRLNSIRIVDVLVNGDVIDFDESNAHQFQGVTVMKLETNSTNSNLTKKELIVSFTTMGIAFKAVASSSVLNVLPVVGNTSLAGNIQGILGNFDEDPNNDLQSPTGEILQPNSTAEKIYDDFGILWRILENDSLFTYEPGKSYGDYQKLSFRPTFVTPTNLPPEVEELCGEDEECLFDYAMTGSAELAVETQQFTVVFNTSVGASYQIKNCDDLPSVEGGVWNASSTIEGSIATFSCYPGYEMEGESNEITCRNTSWGDFGNFTCNLIITSSTFDSTTVLVSTDSTADSVTTSVVEETTIIPTDTKSTTSSSTEGTITSTLQGTARWTTADASTQ
ncbi:LOW QUALITY PROTEIN: sushi domain-containing protein 2-like, partial [Saccostrea cucullata]|uniref:LOW QUALITY PROTEIN: sushi domain-containing protein 2-like n=1 Tax=Saccostrea cuccullata TaxID=36930 RepID=UPI002ED04433